MSITNPSISETNGRWNVVGSFAVVASVLIATVIISFISLTSYFVAQRTADRQDCLRPYTYEVDRAFGELVIAIIERDEPRYPVVVEDFSKAQRERAAAVNFC